jgi:hypothetical protein
MPGWPVRSLVAEDRSAEKRPPRPGGDRGTSAPAVRCLRPSATGATKTVEAFSARLRDEVDLDTLSAEVLAVADQTMEPTVLSLWLRPPMERSRGAVH